MDEQCKPQVFYQYEEDRCVLGVSYDLEANELTITGGRHGFARLAELFAIYAQVDATYDDHHWSEVKGDWAELSILLKSDLRRG